MKFLIENWYVIVALLAVLECIIYVVYRFLKLPTKAQVEKVYRGSRLLLWRFPLIRSASGSMMH